MFFALVPVISTFTLLIKEVCSDLLKKCLRNCGAFIEAKKSEELELETRDSRERLPVQI